MPGYRLLKVGGAYGRAFSQFYDQQPGLKTAPYQEQYQRYIDTCIDFSDYYSRHLNGLGWETTEVISNAEPMQKQWARENDISFDEQNWEKQIIAAQVSHYKPDILYWGEVDQYAQEFRLAIRRENPNIRLHISFKCSPLNNFNDVKDLDLVVTCTPTFVRLFKAAGVRTALVRHAFERSIIEKVGHQEKLFDFTFTGSLGSAFHTRRNDMIVDLMASTPLEIWSFIKATDPGMRLKDDSGALATTLSKLHPQIVNRIPLLRAITDSAKRQALQAIIDQHPDRVHKEVMGVDMFRLLAQSKITLNVHVDAAGKDAGSMRLFEATGMGAMLLTDRKNNIRQLFEPGKEIVMFNSSQQCAELVHYYLQHDDERETIARAGQERTLREHTYAHRAKELTNILESLLMEKRK